MVKLITKEFKLKDLNPDIATKIAKEYNMKEEDITFIRKGYSLNPNDLKFDDKEKSSVDYITTRAVDRDGEIVEPDGIVLTDYMKTPVVLYCHKYHDGLPIGRCAWIKSDAKGLIAKTIYANHKEADDLYNYRKDGFPMAKSIGFVPLETENLDPKKSGGAHRRYPKSILLEYSDVPVPSNPDAVEIAINKGILLKEDAIELGYLELVEEKIIDPSETKEEKEAETKTMEKESIKKTVDGAGNMSVFDIIGCIQKAANKDNMSEMTGMMNPDKMRPADPNGYDYNYCYIEDLFPIDYPNGTVIIECNCRGCQEYFQYDYSCDEGIATLINPKMVEETYIVKPEMKAIKEELSKGWFPGSVNKPEVTENYIRIPVEDAGDTTGKKIRTITISKSKGIKALYLVDEKKIITYLFEKEKWTLATARKWIKDNSKEITIEFIKTIVDLEEITNPVIETKIPTITEELLKELQEDIANLKTGKVLSAKNKKLVQECVDMMDKSKEMLNGLMEMGDKEDEKSVSPNAETKDSSETIPETKAVAEDDTLELEDDYNTFDFSEEDLKEIVTNAIKDVKEKQNQNLNERADESVRKSLGKVY